jgi:transketolase
MRDSMMQALYELADEDKNVMLLTGDLGFGLFEDFAKQFPNQFINIGIAEQNMIGVASGLALEGKIVFVYSIGNFPTLRCLEQIRNDACYHNLNVNIICMGAGFSYGALGMSHHATEDLSIMRALPGVKVISPATAWEASEATRALYKDEGVGYLRIDKSKVENPTILNQDFHLGKANLLRNGTDITLISVGGVAEEAIKASNLLSKDGIDCRVLSLCTVKPIDLDAIRSACEETNGIITIEENNIVGGVGSAVAEVCMDNGFQPKNFKRIGLNDQYSTVVGSQKYLRSYYKIDASKIVSYVKTIICK